MKIDKTYITKQAQDMISKDELFMQAYREVITAMCSVTNPKGAHTFTINNSEKNINGVVPIKEPCYEMLENTFLWFREKPLSVLKEEKQKGGPIDIYKEFTNQTGKIIKRVGLEFETGNISSAHRSLNKLLLGLNRMELDLAIIMMPVFELSYFLTDRVSNYEELEPYFENVNHHPFIFIGFNADAYSSNTPIIPKGKDGMSKRSIRKWRK